MGVSVTRDPFACGCGCTVAGRLLLSAPPPQLLWLVSWDCRCHLHWVSGSPLFVLVHPCLDTDHVERPSTLVHWAETPLLSCGLFTGCCLKGKNKESISHHCDAGVTPPLLYFW